MIFSTWKVPRLLLLLPLCLGNLFAPHSIPRRQVALALSYILGDWSLAGACFTEHHTYNQGQNHDKNQVWVFWAPCFGLSFIRHCGFQWWGRLVQIKPNSPSWAPLFPRSDMYQMAGEHPGSQLYGVTLIAWDFFHLSPTAVGIKSNIVIGATEIPKGTPF